MKTIKVSTLNAYRNEREAANAYGDCAVRSFATFFDISYQAARAELNKFQNRDSVRGTLGSTIYQAMQSFGKSRGIEITHHKPSRNTRKVKTVVAQEEKAYIVSRNHATVAMNGVHYANLTQEEADSKKYRDDANQYAVEFYTMKVVDINLYLSGGVV